MRLIRRRRFPVDHFVLIDDESRASPERLVAEARKRAEALAEETTGRRDHFTLIHNGAGVARRAKPHVHIVCARSRWQKGLIYLLIGLKNLLPA